MVKTISAKGTTMIDLNKEKEGVTKALIEFNKLYSSNSSREYIFDFTGVKPSELEQQKLENLFGGLSESEKMKFVIAVPDKLKEGVLNYSQRYEGVNHNVYTILNKNNLMSMARQKQLK